MTAARRHKYGASPTWACSSCGGAVPKPEEKDPEKRTCMHCKDAGTVRQFGSKRELAELNVLLRRQRLGEISRLEVQPVFPLIIDGTLVGKYIADFAFFEGNVRRILDVKGVMTDLAALKIKIAEAIYRMRVEVVR